MTQKAWQSRTARSPARRGSARPLIVAVVFEDVLLCNRAGGDVEETGVPGAHCTSVPDKLTADCNNFVKTRELVSERGRGVQPPSICRETREPGSKTEPG